MIMGGDSTEQSLQQLVELQRQQLVQNQQMMNMQQMNTQQQKMFAASTYAPSYMPPMVQFSPSTQYLQNQFNAYGSQLMSGPGRYGLIDTLYVDRSRVSNQTRQVMAADYGSRLSNAFMAGAGGLAAGLTDFGIGMAVPGFLGSLALGTIGGAAVGGMFDIGLDQAKQSQAYNKYLLRNSYMITNARYSQNERDIAGFSTEQRHEASNFLRNMNTSTYLRDEEVMGIFQKFTEGGLLKDTRDLKQFKDRMKSLTDTVKQGALLLNETYQTIADLMSEMKKAGIADRNFDPLMSKSRVVGSMLGISATQALTNSMNGARNIVSGTGYSFETALNRTQNQFLYTDNRYETLRKKQQSGTINQEELRELSAIANMGGSQNAAVAITQFQDQLINNKTTMMAQNAIQFFDYDSKEKTFRFNSDAFTNFVNSGANLNDITQRSTSKLNGMSKEAQQQWMERGSTYVINSLSYDDRYRMSNRFMDSLRGLSGYENFTDEQLMGLMGIEDSPLRSVYAGALGNYRQDNGQLMKRVNAYTLRENTLAALNRNNVGVFGEVRNQWEKFKDVIGNVSQPISDNIGDWVQNTQDWLYGKKYTRMDLESMFNHDYSSAGVNNLGKDVYSAVTDVKNVLSSLKGAGINVDGSLLSSLDAMSKFNSSNTQDWRNSVQTNRQIFESSKGLEDIGMDDPNKYKLLKDQSDKNNLSETILAALMKFAQQSGQGGSLGLTGNMLAEASKALGKRVLGAGDEGFAGGSEYLSKLMGMYGGNKNLALSAFFSSQQSVDAAMRAAGIDPEALRSGNLAGFGSVDWKTLGINKEIINKVTEVNSYENLYTGGQHDGVKYIVAGNPIPSGSKVYDVSYDYKRGGKSGVADASGGIDIYDLIHDRAKQFGISPNALASLVGIETGGNINSTSSVGARGLMQIMPDTFKGFIGQQVVMPDGSTKTIEAGDIGDPYVNSWVGTQIFTGNLKKYGSNPFIAYGAYNGGGGFADWVAKAAKRDLGIGSGVWGASEESDRAIGALSAQQIVDLISGASDLTYGPHNWKGETDRAIARFAEIYGEGVIVPTSVTTQGGPKTRTETRAIDVNGKATALLDMLNIPSYRYSPTQLSGLADNVGDSGWWRSFKGVFDSSQLTYTDQIKKIQDEIRSIDNYDPTSHLNQERYAGDMGARRAQLQQQLIQTSVGLDSQFGAVLGVNRLQGESDSVFHNRINSSITNEFNKNYQLMQEYSLTPDSDKHNTAWAKLSTSEKAQVLQFQRSVVGSGKFDQLSLGANKFFNGKGGMTPEGAVYKNGEDKLMTAQDMENIRKEVGSNGTVNDYIEKAKKTSWFTNTVNSLGLSAGASTSEMVKQLREQQQNIQTAQFDAFTDARSKYNQIGKGLFNEYHSKILEDAINTPTEANINEIKRIHQAALQTYNESSPSSKDAERAQSQMKALEPLIEVLDKGFNKTGDKVSDAIKKLEDLKGATSGMSSASKILADSMQEFTSNGGAISGFVKQLQSNAKALDDASKAGPQAQVEAITRSQESMLNSFKAIIDEDRKNNSDNLKTVMSEVMRSSGISEGDSAYKKMIQYIERAEGKQTTSSTGEKYIPGKEEQMANLKALNDEFINIIVGNTKKQTDAAKDADGAADKMKTATGDLSKAVEGYVGQVNKSITALEKGQKDLEQQVGVNKQNSNLWKDFLDAMSGTG